jgi:hypothetical protein
MKPLSHAEYPVTNVNNAYQNGVVTSNGSRELIFAQPNFTFDGSKVDIRGTLHSSGNIDTSANITSVGTMIPASYRSGQVINVVFLEGDQISQWNGSVPISANGVNYQIAAYNYTPLNTSSKIIVEYGCRYTLNGNISDAAGDAYQSVIKIDDVTVGRRYQHWLNGGGGAGTGCRSSTIFPISGVKSTGSLNEKNIRVYISREDGDDSISFTNNSYDAFMRITEIGA